MNLLIHGSIAYDRIMNFPGHFEDNILPDKIHNLNVSFYIQSVTEKRGGAGGNIAYNLSLLGEQARLISSIGKDGASYLAFLESRGLPVDSIDVFADVATAWCSIITDRSNNQITAFCVSAAAEPTTYDLGAVDAADSFVVLAPANNCPDTVRYGSVCYERGLRYMFDPGQTTPDFSGEELRMLIDGSEVFIVNDYEFELAMSKTGLNESDILDMTRMLIVTLGEKGSVIKQKGEADIQIPACMQDKLVDPTGAGDAYRAGLLKGLQLGVDAQIMGRLASVAASFAIEHNGTQEHSYTVEAFCDRYNKQFDEECPV